MRSTTAATRPAARPASRSKGRVECRVPCRHERGTKAPARQKDAPPLGSACLGNSPPPEEPDMSYIRNQQRDFESRNGVPDDAERRQPPAPACRLASEIPPAELRWLWP